MKNFKQATLLPTQTQSGGAKAHSQKPPHSKFPFATLAALFLATSQALPHVFTVTVDPDSVVAGRGSVEAALPTALATAIVEDLLADSMRKSGSDLRGNRGGNRGRI